MEGDGDGRRRREKTEGEEEQREMDVREMGYVMIKGRDDGMESKMGCGVKEMEMMRWDADG